MKRPMRADGPVAEQPTPAIEYVYDDGASSGVANYVRLEQVVYPNDREVNYDYGTAGAVDDIMSRLSAIKDDDRSTTLAAYRYLGAGTIVEEDYVESQTKLTVSVR